MQGMEAWANEQFPDPIENAKALGGVACYTSILKLTYEEYERTYDDGHERVSESGPSGQA
jgi:hypothetical protein